MQIGILTYYFAHNYGAVLQTYALKKYLNSLGLNVEIVKFIPEKLKKEYSLNPFCDGFHPKGIVRKSIMLPKKIKQYRLFENFLKKEFGRNEKKDLSKIFFGSDQIWNENITGKITDYYGSSYNNSIEKISYAASFGTSELSEFQKECIKKYLPGFQKISLREADVKKEVEQLAGKEVYSVVDPVFLIDKEEWELFADKESCEYNDYILYYALRNDETLIKQTEKIAKENNCKILCIHPTGNKLNINGKQLYNIGPCEFVKLIRDARIVSTNSFHAMAFSIIFNKRAFYKSYSSTESRVPSMLKLCNASSCRDVDGIYDFAKSDMKSIEAEKKKSKEFIFSAINN